MPLDPNPSSICLNLGRSGTNRVVARYIGGLDSGCGGECGESHSFRTRTIREDKSSRTKTKTQDGRQPKALYSTVDFSKVDPLYMRRSVSFYREAGGLFTFREHPRVKRIKTECARLSSGNLQLGPHVIGAS
jgi:hypothetical protein